ncbi:hypothetical protein CDD81_5404 [Ophiocordyceps australis]|uniref:Carrier domain-containing protein n=1 Tax=Ophiocordyceps australis TaxID=1399860 RepID=A0A2C5Y574_9HYPO|nr:hypothetical protein CDD81_5404 [Ophiocordyceps australis]
MSAEEACGTQDPTVIVGLACRVAGADTPSKLWENIAEQRDVQRKMPDKRFNVDAFFHPEPSHKGTTNARYGYFLDQDVAKFDASFFGISGKEAEAMDPQQRLLLEVVYEALEDAGITLDEIRGSLTSVFCGSFTNDYNAMLTKDLESYPKYTVTGTGNAILSNRISYFYDLHGTSVTIDTACSSSLVCFHLGSQTLQNGEADISLVVGSALHYDSNVFITMTDLGMLSTNGRCAAFDASGSGYVRGEGIACAVLKRAADARAHGDVVRAVVRATGTNHDGGGGKKGITLPSGAAQERLIRETYARAGLDPADTQYFEAHGTGTAAGDPIEAAAVGAVFAAGRRGVLWMGSVKTNIGHLEGASGLAGIIKTTLALEKGMIPPNMHFDTPNPKIDFAGCRLAVPTRVMAWEVAPGAVRRASINSFGYGGTNAHVVLEEYVAASQVAAEALEPGHDDAQRPHLLPLTSHSPKAGELTEKALLEFLESASGVTLGSLAHSLSTRRTMHAQRSFIVSSSIASVAEQLCSARQHAPWTLAGKTPPRIGFVFTGQGAQWHGMARQLMSHCRLFTQTLERCDALLKTLPDGPEWSIVEELERPLDACRLGETLYSQTICTALQVALVDLLACWGIRPAAVVGHSSGEVAAAYAAGILSLDGAVAAAYYRGLYMAASGEDSARGGMMAVGLPEQKCRQELEAFAGRLVLAAVNSPFTMTVSGDEDALTELGDLLLAEKVFVRRLAVKQAFHSHHMVPLAPAYQCALEQTAALKQGACVAQCRMFSSVTARLADPMGMGAAYWAANMVQPVRFSDALTGILLDERDEQNVDVLVEIGPHPALRGPARQTAQALRLDLPYIGSLARGVADFESLLSMAGTLFCLGCAVDLAAVNAKLSRAADGSLVQTATGSRLDKLPTYSWQHGRYWAETRVIREHRQRPFRHSLLGHGVAGSVARRPRFRNYLRLSELPWLSGHVVENKAVFPGAGYISMAVEAAVRTDELDGVEMVQVKQVVIKKALLIPSTDEGVEVVVELEPVVLSARSQSDTWYKFEVFSYDDGSNCTSHCHGLISVARGRAAPLDASCLTTDKSAASSLSFTELRKRTWRSVPAHSFYKSMAKLGLCYGDCFRLLRGSIESGEGFAMSELVFDPSVLPSEAGDETILHPTLLDAFFHVMFLAIQERLGRPLDEPYVPSYLASLKLSGRFFDLRHDRGVKRFCVASFTKLPSPRVAMSSLFMRDETDDLVMDISGLELTSLGRHVVEGQAPRALFYRLRWQPCFDLLPDGQEAALPELIDLYAHQYPNASMLYIAADLEHMDGLLRRLGVLQGERRRLKHMDVWCAGRSGDDLVAGAEELCKTSRGLVTVVSAPERASYDVVIVNEAVSDAALFVKGSGHVVMSDLAVDSCTASGLVRVFRSKGYTAFRTLSDAYSAPTELSVIVPRATPSTRVASILEALHAAYPGRLLPITFDAIVSGSASPCSNVIVLAGLDESASEKTVFLGAQRLLTSVQKNIVWATEGATFATSRPESAIYLGLVRVASSENDALRALVFDFAAESPASSIAANLVRLLDTGIAEGEVAEQEGIIYIPRVEADDERNCKLTNGPNQEPRLEPFGTPDTQTALALRIGKVGLLETLHFGQDEQVEDTELGDEDVEVETRASSINFRDVAASMGIIEDSELGDECAGLCTRVGSRVTGFKAGDRVVALRPGQGAHRSLVRNPASWCYKLPESMSFVEAAAMPLILGTAWFALDHTARLARGETLLIHAAAGGVGQMAIQIAQGVGARILATVGSPAKRQLLKDTYGLADEQIFSSRNDLFVKGVMGATGGRGVDVVLNSLAGPLLHASWACLAPFGRFVEIGKRDIHENASISMDPFRRNVLFASIDLVTMFEQNKPLGARLFKECFDLIASGKIKAPATIRQFSYAELVKGFRMLQMGRHTGKIVLVPHAEDMVPVLRSGYRNTKLFSAEKTYLLVGGLGGLGRTLSQWMVRKGATKLAFLSRSGADKPEAKVTMQWLIERGISVGIYRGDVSQACHVAACVDSIGSSLGGLFQAAMVLHDKPLETMTHAQWQSCCLPKVEGTRNLHQATLGRKLDFFISFSSVACIVGSKGQANYAAANCFLDALMRHRRQAGLVGTSINVGAVTGVGVVAENEELHKKLLRMGMDTINEQELLYQVEEAVLANGTLASLTPRGCTAHQIISGVGLVSPNIYWASKPMMKNLYVNHDFGGDGAADQTQKNLLAILKNEPEMDKRLALLLDGFLDKIAEVLATPRESILASSPLSAYGLDSIVAVEFRKWFRNEVQVDIALFDILGAASINALVSKTVRMMAKSPLAKETVVKSHAANDQTASRVEVEGPSDKTVNSAMASGELTKASAEGASPLSTFQSRLWFVHSFLDDKSLLNLPVVLHMRGKPDHASLQTTLRELAWRNPVLRSAYFEGEECSMQQPMDDFELDLDYQDFSCISYASTEQQAKSSDQASKAKQALLGELLQHKRLMEMNVDEGQVASFCLVKLSDLEWAMVAVAHHMSIDRGSLFPMMSQFVAIYDAVRAKTDLAFVAAPEFDYVDFTLWHNARLASDLMKPDLEWWRRTLEGVAQSSKLLPFARFEQRPARGEPQREKVRTTIEANMFARMKRISAQSGATPFHFVLAAFRAFIYRYTEEKDVVLLMVDGNRPHPDTESLVGFFVNLAPVRCNDDCDVPFDQLFQATKRRALDAMAHSGVPFDTIVDIVKAQKTSSHMPLGQIAVNYQIHGPAPAYQTVDFVVDDITSSDIPTAAEMQLEAIETSQHCLDLKIEYATLLYSDADMERFVDNFGVFLTNCIRDHRQPVDEIAMCGPLEMDLLGSRYWNTQTRENQWQRRSVLDVIASQQPLAVAINTSDGDAMSYQELMQNASSLAAALLDAGLVPGQCIGVVALPGVEAIVAVLGILMLGACYVALDVDFAEDRLAFMVKDSRAAALVVGKEHEGLAARLAAKSVGGAPVVLRVDEACARAGCLARQRPRQPQDPFYMIYTSGSTGTPKGVVLSEANTQAMLASLNKHLDFGHTDVFLAHTTMAFDLSVVQIFGALTAGATVSLASWETRKDPAALARFMEQQGVSVTYFTPTQYSLLVEANSGALRRCSKYRVALFAGERLPVRLVRAFFHLGLGASLYNTWAPSELVVQTTLAKIDAPPQGVVSLPIGYPLDNCRHYIVDARGEPVPCGHVGELVVGGAQVGVGYLHRPELNAQFFVRNVFASDDDCRRGWTRMFKTGDRGRFRPDGQLEFHGRIAGDKQIKLRGFRLDLGEVEHVLFRESQLLYTGALADIAVVARTVESGDTQLVAFILLRDKMVQGAAKAAVVSRLHQSVKPHLNHYMLPSGYQFIDQLPLTIGGKVNRRELLERRLDLVYPSSVTTRLKESHAADLSEACAPAVDHLDKSVIALFQTVLGGVQVRLHDSFFDRGGNSILLIRLHAKIKRKFKLAPPLPALIRQPTAAAVCAYIRSGGGTADVQSNRAMINWKTETNLPNMSQYMPHFDALSLVQNFAEFGAVLLTGAETFIGVHVLAALLRNKADVTVHVVGSMQRLEFAPLLHLLAKHQLLDQDGLDADQVTRRVCLVPGALSEPNLGLSRSAFGSLGAAVDAIYHLGGHVSLLKPYSALRRLNVAPVLDMIRLAGCGRRVSALHYLSTWSVAHLQTWTGATRTRDDYVTAEEPCTHFTPPTDDAAGYFKTRWVAESLLVEAARRGFPVTIVRASAVTAARADGGAAGDVLDPADELTMRMVVDMVDSGTVPSIGRDDQPGFAIDVVPVDWLAESLVALTTRSRHKAACPSTAAAASSSPTPSLHIFHLSNPQPLALRRLPLIIAQLRPGHGQLISLSEWLATMAAQGQDDASQRARNEAVRQTLETGSVMFSLQNTWTMGVLEEQRPGLVAKCPAVDAVFLKALWERMGRG